MMSQFDIAKRRDTIISKARLSGRCLLSLALLATVQIGAAQRPQGGRPPVQGQDPARPLKISNPSTPKQMRTPTFISSVDTARDGDKLIISVAASGTAEHKEFLLANPPRLVVDLLNVQSKIPFVTLPINIDKVRRLRVRQFQNEEPQIARLVFDLEPGELKHEVSASDSSVRVIFDLGRAPEGLQATPQAPPSSVPAQQGKIAARPPSTLPVQGKPSPSTRNAVASSPRAVDKVFLPISKTEIAAAAPNLMSMRESIRTVQQTSSNQEAGGDRFQGKPLTLDLIDISLVDFFRLMSEEGGINIVMDPGIKGTLSIKVVKVPWDQIFEAALANNGLDKQIEGNLVRIARKSTLQEEAKQREALKKANLLAADVETRVKRLNYTKADTIQKTLKEQQTVRGTVDIDERTNSLVLTDIPSSLDKIIDLIQTLDTPQPQVEIEARIVSATRDFARDIGVQFGFVQGNLDRVTVGGPNTFGTIGGTRPATTPTSTYSAGNTTTGRGAAIATSTRSAGTSTGAANEGNFNVNIPSQKPFGGLGISVGNIFDTFLLDAAITAGETKGLAKLISQPKVTAQNNSPASITQGLRFPVQIIANNTITVQFQNAALTLTVTPQITYEGNIVLDLKIENNTPDFGKSVNGIPSIRTSESNTRVLVSDGGTTVIGGILVDNETTQEDRVPGLASLPLIGNAFRRNSVSHSTQEVLFFITPKVIK